MTDDRYRPLNDTEKTAGANNVTDLPDDTAKAELSRRIISETVPDNSLLDCYLINGRGNSKLADGWPAAVRFHPSLPYSFRVGTHRPALVMPKVDATGAVIGLHAVFLSADGTKKADVASPKKSYGRGGVVVIRADGETLLASEGPEDAITLAVTNPDAAIICTAGAGTLRRVADHLPVATKRVVLVADRDEVGRTGAERAAKAVAERGIPVSIAMPPDGVKDANDLLRRDGADAVRAMIAAAVPFTPPQPDEKDDGVAGLSRCDQLIACAMRCATFWHDADGNAHASVEIGNHVEHYPVRGGAYRSLVINTFGARFSREIDDGDTKQRVPGSIPANALNDALGTLEAMARIGSERVPAVRVAEHENAVVLDLGRPDWSAVVITTDGWEIAARPPVPFVRPQGLRPLPVPTRGTPITVLRHLVNLRDDEDFHLVVAWLVMALRPRGPFPIMVVNGEQGSAKSTFSRVLRKLIDPNAADLRAAPRDERDLLIAAKNGWIPAFDNLSAVNADLSDQICRISTGGGFSKRANYTDTDEVLINVCRPIILNGIPALATRPDLADRAVTLTLPAMPPENRRPEAEFWAAFDGAAPGILGALLDGVSAALRNEGNVKFDRTPRMADFARWSAGAFSAFGWTAEQFVAAYDENQRRGVEETLEADPIATAILDLMSERVEYVGTATALLGEINDRVPDPVRKERAWPKDAIRLSGRLRRVATALRVMGLEVDPDQHKGRGRDKKRIVAIRRLPEAGTMKQSGGDDDHGTVVPKTIVEFHDVNGCGNVGDDGDDESRRHLDNEPPLSWETEL